METIRSATENDAARSWVLERDGAPVGILNATARDATFYIVNIAVDPAVKGGGIGRALMDHARQRARDLGFSEMRLTTHVDLEGTRAFYRRLGWDEVAAEGKKVTLVKDLER